MNFFGILKLGLMIFPHFRGFRSEDRSRMIILPILVSDIQCGMIWFRKSLLKNSK